GRSWLCAGRAWAVDEDGIVGGADAGAADFCGAGNEGEWEEQRSHRGVFGFVSDVFGSEWVSGAGEVCGDEFEAAAGGSQCAVEVHEDGAGKSVKVAKVLGVLGKPVTAMGFVGGERGEFIRGELDRRKIEHDFVAVWPQTRLCVTILDQEAGTITELVEESR